MPVPQGEFAVQLRRRRHEIEQALLAQARSLPSTERCDDPEYREGFRSAVSAAVDHCFALVETVGGNPPPIPAPILQQARLAARNSVGLQAVVRAYTAGAHLFDGFVLEDLDPGEWERLHRSRADALDLLLTAVSAEYERESARRSSRGSARKLECVRRLLNGGLADSARLEYDLGQNHVALIAKGAEAPNALRRITKQADCTLLCVRPDEETTWAWLGRARKIDDAKLTAAISSSWNMNLPLAIGEQRAGPTGWRESHCQAGHVLHITQRGISPIARYRRDGLLAALLRDELLASSLWSRFIGPLLAQGERGATLLETLDTYLRANRNGASAAATLGVARQSVSQRLNTIEELTGASISEAGTEMELALQLHAAGFSPLALVNS